MTASPLPGVGTEIGVTSSINPQAPTSDITSVSNISSSLENPNKQKKSISLRGIWGAATEIGTFLYKARKFPRIIKRAHELRKELEKQAPDKYKFEVWPAPFYDQHPVLSYLRSTPKLLWLVPMHFVPFLGKYMIPKFEGWAESFNAVEFPILSGFSEKPKSQFQGSTFIAPVEFEILQEFKALALEIMDIVPEGCPSEARGGLSVCKINPIYDQIMAIRGRAQGFAGSFL